MSQIKETVEDMLNEADEPFVKKLTKEDFRQFIDPQGIGGKIVRKEYDEENKNVKIYVEGVGLVGTFDDVHCDLDYILHDEILEKADLDENEMQMQEEDDFVPIEQLWQDFLYTKKSEQQHTLRKNQKTLDDFPQF